MASAPLRDTWPPTGCMAVRARLDGDKSLVSDRWERGRPVADALNKATTAIFNKHLVSLCIPRRDRLAHGPRWNDQPAPAETIRHKMRPLCPKRLRSGTVGAYPGHRSQYVVTRMPSRSARFETLVSAPPRWDRFPRESPRLAAPISSAFAGACDGRYVPVGSDASISPLYPEIYLSRYTLTAQHISPAGCSVRSRHGCPRQVPSPLAPRGGMVEAAGGTRGSKAPSRLQEM